MNLVTGPYTRRETFLMDKSGVLSCSLAFFAVFFLPFSPPFLDFSPTRIRFGRRLFCPGWSYSSLRVPPLASEGCHDPFLPPM